MGRKPKDVADAGMIRIIFVSFELWREHSRELIPIQIAVGLPCVFLAMASRFIYDFYEPSLVLEEKSPTEQGLILTLLESLIIQCLEALAFSTNMYAVGLIFTDKIVSFEGVLEASFLDFCKRMGAIWSYVVIFGFGGFIFFVANSELETSWFRTPSLSLLAVYGYISVIIMVASGVSVLDEDYGWGAIKRSCIFSVIKGKLWVAFRFQMVFVVLVTVSAWPGAMTELRFTQNPWHPMLCLWSIGEIAWISFLSQMTCFCAGVAFVSVKAQHGETFRSWLPVPSSKEDDCSLEEGLLR